MTLNRLFVFSAFILATLFLGDVAQAKIIAQAGPAQVSLLEIFSSEGCSSCPPADEWLEHFLGDPKLWKEYVPAVFHVDYWDYLGWKDVFARHDYTERQQEYARAWGNGQVYTPGVVLDGSEWRNWYQAKFIPTPKKENAGILSLDDRGGGKYVGFFEEGGTPGGVYELHAALLGFGVRSEVRAGENNGRTLIHNFIVLDDAQVRLEKGEAGKWMGEVHLNSAVASTKRGIALWVTREGQTEPIQAVGTFLN